MQQSQLDRYVNILDCYRKITIELNLTDQVDMNKLDSIWRTANQKYAKQLLLTVVTATLVEEDQKQDG